MIVALADRRKPETRMKGAVLNLGGACSSSFSSLVLGVLFEDEDDDEQEDEREACPDEGVLRLQIPVTHRPRQGGRGAHRCPARLELFGGAEEFDDFLE